MKNRSSQVLPCNCKHEEQDRLHGKFFRVHNRGKLTGLSYPYSCTVCGSVKMRPVEK